MSSSSGPSDHSFHHPVGGRIEEDERQGMQRKVTLDVAVIDLLSQDENVGDLDLHSSEYDQLSPPGSQVPDWNALDRSWQQEAMFSPQEQPQERSRETENETFEYGQREPHTPAAAHAPSSPKDDSSFPDSFDDQFWNEVIQDTDKKEQDFAIEKRRQSDVHVVENDSEADGDKKQPAKPCTNGNEVLVTHVDSEHKQLGTKRKARSTTVCVQEGTPTKRSRAQSSEAPTLNQRTMTQYAKRDVITQAQSFEDSSDQWFVRIGHETRIIKRGETFLNSNVVILQGFLFTVDDCVLQSARKYAVCHEGACMYLKSTFIQETHAQRLLESPGWRSHFNNQGFMHHQDDIDKVRCLRRNMFQDKQEKIPLYLLNKRIRQSRAPDPFLVYDAPITDKTMSEEYRFAYICRSTLDQAAWAAVSAPPRKPRVVELFAGCGGMHLGLKRAGFDPSSYLVDQDMFAAATLRSNFPEAEVYEEDVCLFMECCKEGRPGYPRAQDVDHVHASPPCQGYSTANRNPEPTCKDTSNNRLSFQFVEALRFFRPRTGSFENVTGMLRELNINYLRKLAADLLEIGYHCRAFIVNSSEFGDPQKRKRLIIFAARFEAYLPDEPTPNEREPITIEAALADLLNIPPVPGSGRVQLADGTVVTQHSNEGGLKLKSENEHLSQCVDFARTVRRQVSLKHPQHDRVVTTRERARLQSFPDHFQFSGGIKHQRDQIGNAVPVNLAFCLGKRIYESHLKIPNKHTL